MCAATLIQINERIKHHLSSANPSQMRECFSSMKFFFRQIRPLQAPRMQLTAEGESRDPGGAAVWEVLHSILTGGAGGSHTHRFEGGWCHHACRSRNPANRGVRSRTERSNSPFGSLGDALHPRLVGNRVGGCFAAVVGSHRLAPIASPDPWSGCPHGNPI